MEAIWRLERRLADAWPALTDEPLGQWRLRAAGGFTGRANSALTTGDPEVPVQDALRTVVSFATRHRIPPTAHVVAASPVEQELVAHGWTVNLAHPGGAESAVLVNALNGHSDQRVVVHDRPPERWWALALGTCAPSAAQRHVLSTGEQVGFGLYEVHGTPVGVVRGTVVQDTLHVARLAVRPEHRRRGIAGALMAEIGAWGALRGATHCALQVATGNTGALELYRRLGFTEHHRYRYWTPVWGSSLSGQLPERAQLDVQVLGGERFGEHVPAVRFTHRPRAPARACSPTRSGSATRPAPGRRRRWTASPRR